MTVSGDTAPFLLDPEEPPAVEVVNANGRSNTVLICDHASRLVPRRLANLGLNPNQLEEHIAWDPGAAEVARGLSARLDAPLVLSGYSRLVIDCNRAPDNEESIDEESAGVSIPGNRGLGPEQRACRRRELFEPYHRAISTLLDERSRRNTLLLSIHSFTPVLDGMHRPWPVGVCYGGDPRLARLMLRALAGCVDVSVGDNQPYEIEDLIDYTIPLHGWGRGLPSVMIEIRQDQIRTAETAAAWAKHLADAWLQIEAEAQGLPAE
ncbi:MAG: N-formylglutamate amidohydrolase [Candidatus Nitrohelix vancouverensis]|uniref:N-formylglutamate amidohydrolase n=1 Tax=Candidatus Nitrohelix vancouverensis TaxID=2705534 RepID=A0A7T0C1H6_9BACT|nr:MAG: N-formylglutamate amidohydrolase [Candidatus Nitrohelix vancouverensis]